MTNKQRMKREYKKLLHELVSNSPSMVDVFVEVLENLFVDN